MFGCFLAKQEYQGREDFRCGKGINRKMEWDILFLPVRAGDLVMSLVRDRT